MESLRLFRARYGFTQQVAAGMLEVNLAQLAMAETGKRSLPVRALEKMQALDEIATQANADDTAALGADYTKFIKQEYQRSRQDLLKYKKDCEYKLLTVKRKLNPLQEKRINAQLSLALISHLRIMSSLSKEELNSIRKAESDIKRTLKLVPQITIDKLTLDIEALGIVLVKLEEKLNDLNDLLKSI